MATSKVILVNQKPSQKKYGTKNWKKILQAVDRLIAADAKRGIVTQVVFLDSASQMKKFSGKPVKSAGSAIQHKRAIDAVFETIRPHYLMILGGPDLIPHVKLRNPIPEGEDKNVPSDLPYACDESYGLDIEKFKGPSRVLGRLPDVNGQDDPAYLISVLNHARQWVSRNKNSYKSYFGLTAEVWKGSSRKSVRKLFNTTKKLNLVPPETLPWTASELKARMHFINCHGANISHQFFGEDQHGFPPAHDSGKLAAVQEGTVTSAECCFGAQLYKPNAKVPMAICNRYLLQGAYGFVGSTNIAYGPADGNGLADLICIYFIQGVQNGASLGRSFLEARQKFIQGEEPVGPHALKTLAQFNLLGDPSIHPIKKPKSETSQAISATADVTGAKDAGFLKTSLSVATLTKSKPASIQPLTMSTAKRGVRRQKLFKKGLQLAEHTVAVDTDSRMKLSTGLRKKMAAEAKKRKLGKATEMACFDLGSPPSTGSTLQPLSKKSFGKKKVLANTRFLVAVFKDDGQGKTSKNRNGNSTTKTPGDESAKLVFKRLLVAKERNGKIESYQEFISR